MAQLDLSLRINPANPDHHLWNNNGTWWCHYTVHRPDYTKARVRRSLATRDRVVARRRRDRLLVKEEKEIGSVKREILNTEH